MHRDNTIALSQPNLSGASLPLVGDIKDTLLIRIDIFHHKLKTTVWFVVTAYLIAKDMQGKEVVGDVAQPK